MKINRHAAAGLAVAVLLFLAAGTLPENAYGHDNVVCDDTSHLGGVDDVVDLGDVTSHSSAVFKHGSITGDGDPDVFVLEVTRPSQLKLGLRKLDYAADLKIYADATRGGNLVLQHKLDRSGTRSEWGRFTVRPGHYCVAVVDGDGGSSSDTNSYTFRYSIHDGRNRNNTPGGSYGGEIDLGDLDTVGNAGKLAKWDKFNSKGPDYIDWFTFTLTGSGNKEVHIQLAALSTDPTITLYQENCSTEVTGGTATRSSDGTKETLNFSALAANKTYCVSAESEIGGGWESYVIRLYRRTS